MLFLGSPLYVNKSLGTLSILQKLAIEFQPICDSHPILVMNYENDMTFQECYEDSRRDHDPSGSFVSEGNFPLCRHWHFQSHHGSAPGQ